MMLAALPQPLEVEEVGRSFFSGLAGPALIATAAIVAAFLAAWVARRNHAELLANDRQLRDLDHARQGLSGAVETVSEAINVFGELHLRAWKAHDAQLVSQALTADSEEFDPPHPRTVEQEEAIGAEARRLEADVLEAATAANREATKAFRVLLEHQQAAWDVRQRLEADGLRLRIALGDGSEVVKSHKELVEAFNQWREAVEPKEGSFPFEGDRFGPPDAPVPEAMEAFISASQQWAADRPVSLS